MKEKNYTGIVPEQHAGKSVDVESVIEMEDNETAAQFFNVVKERLLNVNNWHEIAGNLSAKFQLVDKEGREVNRNVEKGDYFKIDVPGPGPLAGEGFDWVEIEEVESARNADIETIGLRVRPTQNPNNDKDEISHFYSSESTSSLTVTREKNKITAGIYDRNLKTNKDTDSVTDKVRDVVVGIAGILSFSKIQWQSLADGLIKAEGSF